MISFKKALTAPVSLPFWMWSIILILLGYFSTDSLVRSYRARQWNSAYEQCERQAPTPCKIGNTTLTIHQVDPQ
jgi:hypothetical protein